MNKIKIQKIRIQDKEYNILLAAEELAVPTNTALIDFQRRAQTSGKSKVYYARDFLRYLDAESITDLMDVTAGHIRLYAESLVNAEKSNAVIETHTHVIDAIFDKFCELNGRPHETLLYGDMEFAAGGRDRKNKHETKAGKIIRRMLNMKEKNAAEPMINYTKWLSPQEVETIYNALSLRDRCIFLTSIETGYRISSVLSIMANPDDTKNRIARETFSKTGRLHAAEISERLANAIMTYMTTDRANAVKNAGEDCGVLFIKNKGKNIGKPLCYDDYYHVLKVAEKRIHLQDEGMSHLILHTHASRSTYFNHLMRTNFKDKCEGKRYLSDFEICHLMDWRSMSCLENYYRFNERASEPSSLYSEMEF